MEFGAMQSNLPRVVDNKESPCLTTRRGGNHDKCLKTDVWRCNCNPEHCVPNVCSECFPQSDPSISAHHSKYLKKSSHRNGTDAFASEPRGGADLGAKPYRWGINP